MGGKQQVAKQTIKILKPALKKLGTAAKKVGSSKVLGKNLNKIGQFGRKGADGKLIDEAAHLVPRGTGSKIANYAAAKNSRAILQKYGIHIDDAVNGKWLARSRRHAGSGATHGSTHRKVYLDKLEQVLKQADQKGSREAVEKALETVKKKLDAGPWPPYKK